MSILFFPSDTISIKRLVDGGENALGEDSVTEDLPAALQNIPADIQPYSLSGTTDGGVLLATPENKSGIYYKINLPFNDDTKTITMRDMVIVVASEKWSDLVGRELGIVKRGGFGNLLPHLELLVRHGHNF